MALSEGARGLWRIQEVVKVFLKGKTIGEGDDSQGEGLTGWVGGLDGTGKTINPRHSQEIQRSSKSHP